MSKINKTKKNKIIGKIFVWFALILMVGSVIMSVIAPLLWG